MIWLFGFIYQLKLIRIYLIYFSEIIDRNLISHYRKLLFWILL